MKCFINFLKFEIHKTYVRDFRLFKIACSRDGARDFIVIHRWKIPPSRADATETVWFRQSHVICSLLMKHMKRRTLTIGIYYFYHHDIIKQQSSMLECLLQIFSNYLLVALQRSLKMIVKLHWKDYFSFIKLSFFSRSLTVVDVLNNATHIAWQCIMSVYRINVFVRYDNKN